MQQQTLVDCGLFQGLKELHLRNREVLPIKPAGLEAVVLTHAHIDHSGYLPKLVQDDFQGSIYCTAATTLAQTLRTERGRDVTVPDYLDSAALLTKPAHAPRLPHAPQPEFLHRVLLDVGQGFLHRVGVGEQLQIRGRHHALGFELRE